MKQNIRLHEEFYLSEDVVGLSQQFLGKVLVCKTGGQIRAGRIVEVEAYKGPEDKASHAYGHRKSQRTQTMYLPGGVAYVYLCYGIHHLFNIVTAPEGIPHAVLVRALEPLDGVESMLKRRKLLKLQPNISSGPGKLTQAMGIDRTFDAVSLNSQKIWLEDRNMNPTQHQIVSRTRIGIDYAQEHKDLPWRFYIKNNPFVSQY